jgi:hypothetical protein
MITYIKFLKIGYTTNMPDTSLEILPQGFSVAWWKNIIAIHATPNVEETILISK